MVLRGALVHSCFPYIPVTSQDNITPGSRPETARNPYFIPRREAGILRRPAQGRFFVDRITNNPHQERKRWPKA